MNTQKFKIPIVLCILLLIPIVSAENPCGSSNDFLGTFQQYSIITLEQTCDTCTYVNLSNVKLPNSSIVTYEGVMAKGGTHYNYSFSNTGLVGCYSYSMYGDKDGSLEVETMDFVINARGEVEDGDFTQSAFFIGILIIVSIFFYLKVSKFFGSLMIMIIGLGVMLLLPLNGWIGWMLITFGFVATIYSILYSKGKKRRYR